MTDDNASAAVAGIYPPDVILLAAEATWRKCTTTIAKSWILGYGSMRRRLSVDNLLDSMGSFGLTAKLRGRLAHSFD